MKCDNCGQSYTQGEPRDYGSDARGLRYCDACKLPQIEDLLQEAAGKITPAGIDHVMNAIAQVRGARQAQDWAVADALTQAAWNLANGLFNALAIRPELVRDRKRQAGTHAPRRPEVDAWITKQLERDPSAKSPALWGDAPDWITDQIEFRAFAARVTKQRKLTLK